jgi:hypothetical protein
MELPNGPGKHGASIMNCGASTAHVRNTKQYELTTT